MPTKAGRLKLSDIRRGKSGWVVFVIPWLLGRFVTRHPEFVTFEERPYPGMFGATTIRFTGKLYDDNPHTDMLEAYAFDMHRRPAKDGLKQPSTHKHRLFVSEKAARRYQASLGLVPISKAEFKVMSDERARAIREKRRTEASKDLVTIRPGALRHGNH